MTVELGTVLVPEMGSADETSPGRVVVAVSDVAGALEAPVPVGNAQVPFNEVG